MVRSFCCIALCLFAFSTSRFAKAQKHINRTGYVTHLNPPSSFQFNQQQVTIIPSTKVAVFDDNGKINEEPFSIQAISLGAHVSLSGTEDLQTHVITAKRVELFKDRPQVKVS